MVLLAYKPNHEDVPWWDFMWQISLSYHSLNVIMRPFKFLFQRCEDVVLRFGKSTHRVSLDMDSG